MIRFVELQNWRAYQDAAIDLDSKVVFFVAPNGVGKSSLMEAVRWCLLGEPANRKARSAVRLGSPSASVSVEVGLEQPEQTLRVERSLTPAGRTTFAASLDGRAVEEGQYLSLLVDRWKADRGLIDRLMFNDSQLSAAKSAFPVRDHLAATLGVKPLLEAATGLQDARKAVAQRVADMRADLDDEESAVVSRQTTASNAAAELNTITERRQEIAAQRRQSEADASLAGRWDEYREATVAHNSAVAAILVEVGEVMEVDADAPEQSLIAAREEATALVTEARQSKADLEIASARSAGASDLLANPVTTCPTCLRPLSEHERHAALAQHGDAIAEADSDAGMALEAETAAQDRLDTLSVFMARLAALHAPSPPADPDPGPESGEQLREIREAEQSLAEEAGRLQAIAAVEADQAALGTRIEQKRAALSSAAHQEQLLSTAIEVLNQLADKTLRDRIDPLIEELAGRWKLLFGTEGLTLDPSGQLSVNAANGTLDIADLSGGERATAILIARLLVTASTTRIPTVWFDEPLEHLDPRRRSAVARTIVRAGQTDTVAQLIVTTYEERIARQLAATDPDNVRVVYADARPRT
ncbi:AAA family ATPase [Candidatus Poriferisodalis sp.]|uniref:AAA family ATPase n=1 Tax=Candidatus Poriferisodalis sp. TaxID=3101277 RepID=UPI003B02E5DD